MTSMTTMSFTEFSFKTLSETQNKNKKKLLLSAFI